MAKTGVRVAITLACTECKRRNYQTKKSKRNTPDRVEFKKYCRWCGNAHPAPGDPLGRGDAKADLAAARAPRPDARPAGEVAGAGRPRRTRVEPACSAASSSESLGRAARRSNGRSRTRSIQGTVVVLVACIDRRRLPLAQRPALEARRPEVLLGQSRQPMFRWYVVNTYSGPREQGQGQPRAPHRVDGPAPALPPRRRPDRAGDRDEGRPEGADREARAARATCS